MEKNMNWLLLRGLVRESRHWGEFPKVFAAGMGVPDSQVHVLDLPGLGEEIHGESPLTVAEIAEALRSQWIPLKDKSTGPWAVVAMSLGAMAAIEWARLYPGDVERLVMINSSARDLSKPWQRFSLLQIPRALRITVSADARQREAEIYRLTSNGPLADVKSEEWGAFAPDRRRFIKTGLRQLWAAIRFRSPPQVDIPLLILTSKGDTFVDYECSAALAKKYNAPLKVHLSSGHDLCLDDPQWVIDQTRAWIDGTSS